jgi:hypothetical protein
MENRVSFFEYLFRPFRFIAGTKALILGLAAMALLSVLGYYGKVYFDGVIDIHAACSSGNYWVHLWYILSAWVMLSLVLFALAAIFSKSRLRIVDMTGTLALAKFPLLFAALWGLVPLDRLCPEDINSIDVASLMLLIQEKWLPLLLDSVVMLLCIIWSIVLMYNAFSISGNLKGGKGVWLFILGLVVAEIIVKIASYYFLKLL